MNKKIVISFVLIVTMFSLALGIGVYAFNNTTTTKAQTAEVTEIEPINAVQIQKSENTITRLATSPMDKAFAKTNADIKAKIKIKKAKAKKAKAKKAEMESKYKSLGTFNATAYCGCAACCGSAGGHTASGTTPTAGRTIATDPSVIPLGSKVLIDGKEYIAEDTGGAIGGKRVDIFFSSHSAALQFGRRSVDVSIEK